MMSVRHARSMVLIAVALAVMSGCTPDGGPTPSPTVSSSAEAFAAAEGTYRAYVDARNSVDLSKPSTFEPMFRWLTGDELANAKKSYSGMSAEGVVIHGSSHVVLVEPASISNHDLDLAVCLDVSAVTIVDRDGKSLVSDDRPKVQPLDITFVRSTASPTGWLISGTHGREGDPLCS